MIEALYEAADHAGLLTEVLWTPTNDTDAIMAKVDFRAPDETVLNGLGLSTDYTIRYPASTLVGLTSGETLTVRSETYRVRETRSMGDGSEMQATLTRL